MARLPDFLVIGAAKAGTTTLYHHLRQHPQIFVPLKETSGLLQFEVSRPLGRRQYEFLFRKAGPDQRVGEVEVSYSARPLHPQVLENARSVFSALKLVYIARDPVERIISHHYHDYRAGSAHRDINVALGQNPSLIEMSRYTYQLEPWVDAFGRDSLFVIRFEDYVKTPEVILTGLWEFLDVQVSVPDVPSRAHNVGAGAPMYQGLTGGIAKSHLYRKWIRPLLSDETRSWAAGFLPRQKDEPIGPSVETLRRLVEVLRPEVEGLAQITKEGPWWDLQETADRLGHT